MNMATKLSSETYRSVCASPNLEINGIPIVQQKSTSVNSKTGHTHEAAVVGSFNSAVNGAQQLPCNIERFRPQPFHVFLRGPSSTIFDAFQTALQSESMEDIKIEAARKDKGKLICTLRGDQKFNVLFWQVPEDKVLMELVVVTEDSTLSWNDMFERILMHAAVKPFILSHPPALNSEVTPLGYFVKPIM